MGMSPNLKKCLILVMLIMSVWPIMMVFYLTSRDEITVTPVITKDDTLSDVMHFQHICRLLGNGSKLSNLDGCAQYIRRMITENNQAKQAFEKYGVGVKTERQKKNVDMEVDVRSSLSNNSANQSKIDLSKETHLQISYPCKQHTCFEYSLCPLTSPFSVYFYKQKETIETVDPFIRSSVTNILATNPYITSSSKVACLYLVLLSDMMNNPDDIKRKLFKLPSWNGRGQNHVLLNLASKSSNILQSVDCGDAIIVQSTFDSAQYRHGFDIISPMLLGKESSYVWTDTPFQFPIRRKFILSFHGNLSSLLTKSGQSKQTASLDLNLNMYKRTSNTDKITLALNKLKTSKGNKYLIDLNCPLLDDKNDLCKDDSRIDILKQSTYVLIIAPADNAVSSTFLQLRLYEALKHGAIPVILGERIHLPFSEYITWEKAAIILPKARVSEMHFYLSSIHYGDVLSLRRQGWFIWTTYLSSTTAVINGILATIRTRLSIPASASPKAAVKSIFSKDFKQVTKKISKVLHGTKDFFPRPKGPQSSPKYQRNFTSVTIDLEMTWNSFPGPINLFPNTPFKPPLPSNTHFMIMEPDVEFEPIGNGTGGTGRVFQESLGGNIPAEQFTIIILTYNRLSQLLPLLENLMGLPYLNKVLVVWNSPNPPASDVTWPHIHVPIKIIQTETNSLNNRFLPYDEIETEAILSLDDDMQLRHDEIIFAFRVWREAQDRIVGFPGRFHSWDVKEKGFRYSSDKSCEVSMVLTGSAFFHVYYAYLYSNVMPQIIREKVDEYMNCEDIAMNFLVSHITRKPPVKVTGRSSFQCPTCKTTLWTNANHFINRHKCIRFFSKIYGYTPLLYTQYRADSVQYTSRHKGCYKNV